MFTATTIHFPVVLAANITIGNLANKLQSVVVCELVGHCIEEPTGVWKIHDVIRVEHAKTYLSMC